MGAAAVPLAVASTVLSAAGSIRQGQAAKDAAKVEAEQLEVQGAQARGAASRRAQEEERRADIVRSNALAAAASSGGGASNPTVDKILSDIAAEGEFRALSALHEGETAGASRDFAAEQKRFAGQQAFQQGLFSAGATLLGGGKTLAENFAPEDGFQPTAPSPRGLFRAPNLFRDPYSGLGYF